jgi:serine/threonine protein kinase
MGKVYLVRSRSNGQAFAVKKTRLRDPEAQRNFFAELQTWIDLPEHPHLAACRFFRTVGDEAVVFGEFVDGGSLAEWIRQRRLTRLEQVLDVAIQFAWGLHAAHEHGLIHQDVKPGNVLLTRDGVAKVADFGLARARVRAGETTRGTLQTILVSAGGMTPAYCSPEQAAGQPLSRRTDIWSWGVSVLEMFTGEVTWHSGATASEVLEAYLQTGPSDRQLPTMPADLAAILQKCFHQDPSRRYPTMITVAACLRPVYERAMGKKYERQPPTAQADERRGAIDHDRRTTTGVQWTDPREWLLKAFKADGRDPSEIETLLPERKGSRKAQAIADLAAYEEARRIFQRLVVSGRKDLEPQLADLCMEKAFVHQNVDDIPGAVALYDRALAIRERLVLQEGRAELRGDLARVTLYRAETLLTLGDRERARNEARDAVTILKAEVDRTGRADFQSVLAWATKALKDVL